ncbi:MAG: putative zinc-binding protein [Melioribacteraceae bacterium]|jgi:uncharacterized metal-binding protein
MSCITGIGGNIPSLVKKAQSGKSINDIDGCLLECAKSCLKKVGVKPNLSFVLTADGLKKTSHEVYDQKRIEHDYNKVLKVIKNKFSTELKQLQINFSRNI